MKSFLNGPKSRGNRRSSIQKHSKTVTAIKVASLLFAVVAIAAFHPSPASAQSYCGPLLPLNFYGVTGEYPSGHLAIDGQNNLYGTTTGGQGIPGDGTIWKYSSKGGLTTLGSFTGPIYDESGIGAPVMNGVTFDSHGNFWGATYGGGNDFAPAGGASGLGTIYELTTAGVFTTLVEFSGPNGELPGPVVFDSQGNLWGTAVSGGAANDGALFEYSPASGELTNPVTFTGGNGTNPSGLVAFDSQGNLYGVTSSGGTGGFGSLWEYSAQGVLTTLVNFTGLNGETPTGGVTLDGKGNIYGTTNTGGASGYGTIWKYSLSTAQLTTLYSFTATGTTGQNPGGGGVTLDANGNLYGTTTQGGANGDGVVWEYSSAGVLTDLVTFTGLNGQNPQSTLVFDSLGNLWGTTTQGGTGGYGAIFELTPNTGGGCGPTLSSLTLNPTTIPNGGTSTGTVTLSGAAPSGGSVVGLSSNSSFIIVPGSVTVPAGASSATFAVTTNGFVLSSTAVTITASLGSNTVQASLTETPGVNVSSISLNPTSVPGGSSSTGTVTLTAAAPSGGNAVLVSVSHNNAADPNPPVLLPIIVTVAAGKTSATFTLGTTNDSSNLTFPVFAQSGTATVSTNFTVTPGAAISSLTLNPTSVSGGNNSTGTVTLSAKAPSGGAVVPLGNGNTLVANIPSSVTVPARATSATFTVSTESVSTSTSVAISGTYGGAIESANLTVTPGGAVTLSSLTLNPTSVTGGSDSTGTVTLSGTAPSGGTVVTLTSGNTSVATVPSSVTVAAGNTSATFSVSTTSVSQNTNVSISGTYGGANQSATLTVTPAAAVTLSSLTLNPTSVSGGNSSTGTVTLSGNAPSGGAVVTLTSGNTSVATVPSSVTVAAGNTSATFTVNTTSVSSNTNVTISGTYGGASQSATLTVTARRHH